MEVTQFDRPERNNPGEEDVGRWSSAFEKPDEVPSLGLAELSLTFKRMVGADGLGGGHGMQGAQGRGSAGPV